MTPKFAKIKEDGNDFFNFEKQWCSSQLARRSD